MIKTVPQHPEVLKETERLQLFFETNPILLREWISGCMVIKDIPAFIKMELTAARTFNPSHFFNPPLKRLQQLEQAVLHQTVSPLTAE